MGIWNTILCILLSAIRITNSKHKEGKRPRKQDSKPEEIKVNIIFQRLKGMDSKEIIFRKSCPRKGRMPALWPGWWIYSSHLGCMLTHRVSVAHNPAGSCSAHRAPQWNAASKKRMVASTNWWFSIQEFVHGSVNCVGRGVPMHHCQ